MGQLNFFMTQDEIRTQIKELIASDLYLLFNGAFFDSEQPTPLKDSNINLDMGRIIIWIINPTIAPICSTKGTGNYSDKFLFDYFLDPIIEFDIETPKDNLMTPSRLYFKTGWVKDKLVRDIHVKAANKIVRAFKQKLMTLQEIKPFYISKGTIEFLDNGFEIELGPRGKRIDKKIINGT